VFGDDNDNNEPVVPARYRGFYGQERWAEDHRPPTTELDACFGRSLKALRIDVTTTDPDMHPDIEATLRDMVQEYADEGQKEFLAGRQRKIRGNLGSLGERQIAIIARGILFAWCRRMEGLV
jgi:hypothetical protein